MDSPTQDSFACLTPDVILKAAEHFNFRCTGRILPLNSMENRVYEMEIEVPEDQVKSRSDTFRVAKFYRPLRWTKEQISEEHQFLYDLEDAEIPVITPLRDREGNSIIKISDTEIFFAVFPKSGGRIPQEFRDEELEWMGRLIARMHNTGARKTAPSRLCITPEIYGSSNATYLIESKILPPQFHDQYRTLVDTLCVLVSPWFDNIETIRIHGDLHLANILWNDAGPKLVDFDDMVTGPPIQDLWLAVPGRDDEARRQFRVLLNGYSQMRKFDYSTVRLIEPLRTLRMIHFSAWIGRRWDDPAFRRVFSHFGTFEYWQEQLADLKDQLSIIQQNVWDDCMYQSY